MVNGATAQRNVHTASASLVLKILRPFPIERRHGKIEVAQYCRINCQRSWKRKIEDAQEQIWSHVLVTRTIWSGCCLVSLKAVKVQLLLCVGAWVQTHPGLTCAECAPPVCAANDMPDRVQAQCQSHSSCASALLRIPLWFKLCWFSFICYNAHSSVLRATCGRRLLPLRASSSPTHTTAPATTWASSTWASCAGGRALMLSPGPVLPPRSWTPASGMKEAIPSLSQAQQARRRCWL